MPEPVMVDFVHQRQQPSEFPAWKTFAGKPVRVVAGKVGDQSPLVLAETAWKRQEACQISGVSSSGIIPVTAYFFCVISSTARRISASRMPVSVP